MGGRSGACLGERVGDYVDGTLPPAEALQWDRHLVTCMCCRSEVDLDRRLRTSLRAAPDIPPDLRALLMSVSQEIPVASSMAAGSNAAPWRQVAVLSPTSPAQHRSALRSAVLATAAAGASVAAVWGLGVTPSQAPGRSGSVSAVPSRPAAEPTAFRTAPVRTVMLLETGSAGIPSSAAQFTP